jgi:hypothetical protein
VYVGPNKKELLMAVAIMGHAHRSYLRDNDDEGVLADAEDAFVGVLLEAPHSMTLGQARRVVMLLTVEGVRHHTQTLLDLTPTRPGDQEHG